MFEARIRYLLCLAGLFFAVSNSAFAQTDANHNRLVEPAVAAALRLSDAQKAQVTAAVAARDEALRADGADAKAVRAAHEAKLAAILTARQSQLFQSLFSGTRLRFDFRAQKWDQVLEYIASEADLSLVMSETPPGVFNYSDSKEYTPTEAIDLINGWLLTKGYTLVRRERLLMCLSLKDGIPANSVPRVTPAELATRGRFELVTTLIPLEGRPIDAVKTELEAIKGTYGKITPLASTGQILITDTAGNVKAMQPIIKAIPIPRPPAPKPKPKPKPPAPKPPAPVIQVHPIKHANPEQAGEVLKKFVSGTILVDSEASQITISAPPAVQETARSIIARLEQNQGPDKQPTLKLYPVRTRDVANLMATIELAAPAAKVRMEDNDRTLVAWATPKEQTQVQNVLEQLNVKGQQTTGTQLETYNVERVSPSAALALLQELLPDARMTANDDTDSLIVVGSLEDHQAVRSLIEQIDAGKKKNRTLKTYPVDGITPATVTALAASFAPTATVTFDATSENAMVLAKADEHQRIGQLIQQLSASAAKLKSEVRTYPTTDLDVPSVTSLLATVTPNAIVTSDTANRRLVVIGSAVDHQELQGVLEQVRKVPTSRRELKPYTVPDGQTSATVTSLLTTLIPGATVTGDTANNRLLIVANADDHKLIGETLNQLGDGSDLPELRFYPLEEEIVAGVEPVLASVAPSASITVDATARRLSAVATKADHDRIKSTLGKLQLAATINEKPGMKIYEVSSEQRRRFTSLATNLATQLPGMKIIPSDEPRELTVWAKPAEQEVVAGILDQLKRDVPVESKPALSVYPITKVDAASVQTVVQELFPDAKVTLDEKASRLLINALPEQHKAIAAAIKQLDTASPVATDIKLMSYPVDGLTSATVVRTLTAEVPEATVVADTIAKTIIVRGRMKEHREVAAIIESMRQAAGTLEPRRVVVYPAVGAAAATTIRFITTAFDGSKAVVDTKTGRLTIWATDKQHAEIREAVAALTEAETDNFVSATYTITGVRSATLVRMLTLAMPDARVVANTAGTRLVAWATAEDQKAIKTIIAGATNSIGENRALQIYDTTDIGGADARPVIEASVTDVAFTESAGKLIGWVLPEEHETITKTIAQLTTTQPFKKDLSLKAYSTTGLGADARTVLQQAVPNAAILAGPEPEQLLIRGTPRDHKAVTETIKQMQSLATAAPERELRSFSIEGLDAVAVRSTLEPLLDANVQLTIDPTGQRLFVRATPDKQKKISELVQSVVESLPSRKGQTTKTYRTLLGDADEVEETVKSLFPYATIVTDGDRKVVVATALPEEHTTIEKIVKEMVADGGEQRVSAKTYPLKKVDGVVLAATLGSMYRGTEAQISYDRKSQTLLAVARDDQHVAIKGLIEQMQAEAAGAPKRELATFNIEGLDGDAVRQTLEPLMDEDVRVTVDPTGRRLFVHAFAEKQKQIGDIVESVIKSLPSREGVVTKAYRTLVGDADEVSETVEALFPDAVVVFDQERKVLVATALADEHKQIKEIVNQMVEDGGESRVTAKTYPIRTGDGEALESTLEDLYQRTEARITYDSGSRTLLAIARADQHEAIKALIDQVESAGTPQDNRTVEFYSLEGADGDAVQSVVEDLLDVVDPKASVVNDEGSRQLVVTTVGDGHKKVKDAIERLQSTAAPREFEVFQLERLEAFSAQLAVSSMFDDGLTSYRDQPVVQSDDDSGQLLVRGTTEQIDQMRALLVKMGETQLRKTKGKSKLRVIPINGDAAEAIKSLQKVWPKLRRNPIRVLVPGQKVRVIEPNSLPPVPDPEPDSDSSGGCGFEEPIQEPAEQEPVSLQVPSQDADDQVAPVLLVPGKGRITISSDDSDALDQMESLLRAVYSGSGRPRSRKDFNVYALTNAAASTVGDLLNNIFGRDDSPIASGSVVIMPDQRLNALIVFAGRNDRERIEELIEILDSDNIPDTVATNRTKVIPIRHADAERINEVIAGIYRAQMSAGGSRQNITIPRGVPSQVATVLRQINAASSSPLLSVQVEKTTNSLVVMAPQNLLDEVSSLIEQLDTASGQSRARAVSIIELQKTNSRRVMEVLDRVLTP